MPKYVRGLFLQGREEVPLLRLFGVFPILLALIWAMYRAGTSAIPSNLLDLLVEWPPSVLPEGASYLNSSSLSPLLAVALGIDSGRLYVLLHLFLILAAVFLLGSWAAACVSKAQKLRAIRILILSSITAVMLQNVGSYDPLTLICLALCLFSWTLRFPVFMFLSGALLGFQHFEQGIALVTIWSLGFMALRLDLPEKLRGLSPPFWVIPGLILGKILSVIVLSSMSVPSSNARIGLYLEWFRLGLNSFLDGLPLVLWGGFGGLWVILLLLLRHLSSQRLALLSIAFVIALFFSATTIDNVRVLVVLLLPVSLMLIVLSLTESNRLTLISPKIFEAIMWISVPLLAAYNLTSAWVFISDLTTLS